MSYEKMTLPFVIKTRETQIVTYSEELAVITCLAELQRKKPGFLRDSSEQISSISKMHYPLWLLQMEDSCIVLDGLATLNTSLSFEEPIKMELLDEALKRSSGNPNEFSTALKGGASRAKEFTTPSKVTFQALIGDNELLSFLKEYIRTGEPQGNDSENVALIPTDVDSKAALEIGLHLRKTIRTMEADAKELDYLLKVLKDESSFHINGLTSEIELLEQNQDLETEALKPSIDKAIKKINEKQEKTIAHLQKAHGKEIGTLERKREILMRRLHVLEQRKDAARNRVEAAKRKKNSRSSSGSFALQKYEKDFDRTKKEINKITEDIDKIKRTFEANLKQKKAEFQKAISQEEEKLNSIVSIFGLKKAEKQRQIDEIQNHTATLSTHLSNKMDTLKRSCDDFRNQIKLNFKPEFFDFPILAYLPTYLIKYSKNIDQRYIMFSPLTFSEDASTFSGLKNALALNPEPKLKNITHFANRKLQDTISSCFLTKTQNDEIFKSQMNELCQSNNLVDLNNFAQILNEGLDGLEKKGWIRREESTGLCKHVLGDLP